MNRDSMGEEEWTLQRSNAITLDKAPKGDGCVSKQPSSSSSPSRSKKPFFGERFLMQVKRKGKREGKKRGKR